MGDAGDQLIEDLMRLRPEGVSSNAWAVKAGVSRTIWADIRRHGNPSRKTLEKLLAAAGSSLAEFEALRITPAARETLSFLPSQVGEVGRDWRQAPHRPLPVFGCELAGEWERAGSGIELLVIRPDQVIDRLARPAALAADDKAFALTIMGDSMWPRFRLGRRIAVSPIAPIGVGDDVLVLLRGDGGPRRHALLNELAKRSAASLTLRQFSPDKEIAVAQADVEAVYRVMGELF